MDNHSVKLNIPILLITYLIVLKAFLSFSAAVLNVEPSSGITLGHILHPKKTNNVVLTRPVLKAQDPWTDE